MNAWNEPDEPNPVAQIIALRTVQVGGATSAVLGTMALSFPMSVVGAAALVGGLLGTIGLSAYFVRTFDPRTRYGALPLWVSLPSGDSTIALSFDDGPHPDTTPRLLDALSGANAHATFFVVAERAARYPALMQRIVEEGHAVGVHGLCHRTMVTQSAAQIKADLHEAVRIIETATGITLPRPVLLRPPYGFRTATMARVAHEEGFLCVAWSLDGRDYDTNAGVGGADELAVRITTRLQPGDIVLLHERPHAPTAAEALPRLLSAIREKGYTPVALRVGRVGDPAHHELGETAKREKNHENA